MRNLRTHLRTSCSLVMLALSFALFTGCGSSAASTSSGTKSVKAQQTFTRANWAQLDSNPDAYKSAKVDVIGKVFTVPQKDDKGTYWQMYVDPKHSELNTVVGIADPNFNVKQDDYVHVIGTVAGKFEGTNAFGAKLSLPTIKATSAKVVDALAAASPAIRTATVNASQTQDGLTITVSKVEFAADETRVFVTVVNNSSATAHFWDFNAKAVQAGTQYDAETGGEYTEVQSDILSGVTSKGVIVFKPMDPKQALQLVFDADSEDYEFSFQPYTFTIKP